MEKSFWFLFCLVLVTGCASFNQPCSVQSARFISQIGEISSEWDDANALANNTPRLALPPVISQLQGIRRKTEGVEAPECAKPVKAAIVAYMDRTIEAFLGFAAQEAEDKSRTRLEQVKIALDYFSAEYSKLKQGIEPYN